MQTFTGNAPVVPTQTLQGFPVPVGVPGHFGDIAEDYHRLQHFQPL